jgi:hypothetical protein
LSVLENTLIHILSLGAGVQSSTLALMAAKSMAGHRMFPYPTPVAAIFADTGAEPAGVYSWLSWLETQLPFPVIRASAGNLTEDSVRLRTSKKSGNTYLKPSLPVYTEVSGKASPLQRQCTLTYKVDVVRKAARKLMKEHGAKRCTQWIGISTDEAHRMKPSPDPRFTNVWPLIDSGMSRQQCLEWMASYGYPKPPRSACVYCPYHSNEEWARIKREEPESFEAAVQYERKLSAAVGAATSLKATSAFLHRSLKPIDTVQFEVQPKVADQFGNECEGMCGV